MSKVTAKILDYYGGITNPDDCSALTDELKLREDTSDLIKVHPELNCASSPRPRVRENASAPIVFYIGSECHLPTALSPIFSFCSDWV